MFCIAKSEYVTPFFGRIAHLYFLHGLIGQLVILPGIYIVRQIFTMLTFVRCLWGVSYHRVMQWALRITKKRYKLNSIQKTLLGGDALYMPKYNGQKSTFSFDRKVLESSFFKQNYCNRSSKRFPYVRLP